MTPRREVENVRIAPTTGVAPHLHPSAITGLAGRERTRLVLNTHEDGRLPHLAWLGTAADGVPAEDVVALAAPNETPLTSWDAWLVEGAPSICPTQADGHLGRPALLGFRVGQPGGATPSFTDTIVDTDERAVVVRARDVMAGLELGYVVEALPGGSLRIRTSLTNLGRSDYVWTASTWWCRSLSTRGKRSI